MGNAVANAIDWYVDKLNRMHLVPANAAAMIRDISSKQLADSSFTPRPLTIDNFTDAELDAVHRLAFDGTKYVPITSKRYADLIDVNKDINGNKVYASDTGRTLGEYLSPARIVGTTIGQAAVTSEGEDHVLRDVYDTDKVNLRKQDGIGSGDKFEISRGNERVGGLDRQDLDNVVSKNKKTFDTPYGRIRFKAGILGHKGTDPDSSKIRTELSMNAIKKRLGDRLGKYGIELPASKKDVVMRTAGAGALTAAPIGAALGALSGAMLLIDKDKRKRWLKTMLTHVLGGAALAATAGGLGGGLAASDIFGRFQKKADDDRGNDGKKSRKRKISPAILKALAYALPVAAIAGMGGAAASGYGKLKKEFLDKNDVSMETLFDVRNDDGVAGV